MRGLVLRLRRSALALSTAGAIAAGMAVTAAAPVAADYGNTAVYQIEISGNYTSPTGGFGVWLWIELNSDGTGDYAGSDCGHTPGVEAGAVSDRGDITSWSISNGVLTINGVALFGGLAPVTITVPSTYGHYRYDTISAVFHSPFMPFIPGWTIVQVAP